MDEVLKQVLAFGLLPTFLLILLFLVIQEPDRAEKLKSFILKPLYDLFKWFSKEYISSKVSSTVNEFFRKNLKDFIIHSSNYSIKIKWVSESKDPIFNEEGSLILRLRQDEDQTRNILNAAQVALPRIVCPLIRGNINQTCEKSIDLTILQKLSEKIGRHGKSIFKKYFLDPETKDDKTIGELISKLIELDNHGFFIPILINELELIGDDLFSSSDHNDYSNETINFIEYLLSIVNRNLGQEIELIYRNGPFNVGTILLAKALRADTQGLRPYLKRLRTDLEQGCDSIYFIAYPNAFPFFERLIKALESYERINVEKVITTNDFLSNISKAKTIFKIAILSKNKVFTDEIFRDKIQTNEITVGRRVNGYVEDVSTNEALVNVLGMRAYIKCLDCSWVASNNCNSHIEQNKTYEFEIKSVDFNSCQIFLTLRFAENDPWNLVAIPKVSDEILIRVVGRLNNNLVCCFNDKLEVLLPYQELSWYDKTTQEINEYQGTEITVKIIEVDTVSKKIVASIKQLEKDPWDSIHKELPKGTEFNGRVIEINDNYILVDIGKGINGILPSESLKMAGFEYQNFQENMVVGQGIEVYVSKVFIARRKIRLDLKRNKI
jgi:hypothetical protein